MIVRDLRPLNVVNGEGFKAVISYLEPGCQIPSDRCFMSLIEKKYDEVKVMVKQKIELESGSLCVTGDIWTSIANDAYLTITVHFISEF